MLNVLRLGQDVFEPVERGQTPPEDSVWIDLLEPALEEEHAVEAMLQLALPTREEMAEIEVSSRLYTEDGGLFLTASLVAGAETAAPTLEPVTFVLARERLVTIRYVEPKAFGAYAGQIERQASCPASGALALIGLLEAIVDRTADVLEKVAEEVDGQARVTFDRRNGVAFSKLLSKLGRLQGLTAKVRGSLASLGRLCGFAAINEPFSRAAAFGERLTTLQHDINSLSDHAGYVSAEITFLLDASLGFISVEQNEIFKVLAVFSAVLMPPTLVAGIYGMNFAHMPELAWRGGYPFALALMAAVALAPMIWFKRKGWF